MKPGVEDSSMKVTSSYTPASMALSIRETTSAIILCLHPHRVPGRRFGHRRGIVRSFNCAIALPAIVLIVTAASEPGAQKMVRHSTAGANSSGTTLAEAGVGIQHRSAPHIRALRPPFCDPIHSIEHRRPLFAYRGFQKRHHQRKEEACEQP